MCCLCLSCFHDLMCKSKNNIAEVGNIITVVIIDFVMLVFSAVFSVSVLLYTFFSCRFFT